MKAVSEAGMRVLIQFLFFWQRMGCPIEESKKRKKSPFKGLFKGVIVNKWPSGQNGHLKRKKIIFFMLASPDQNFAMTVKKYVKNWPKYMCF